MLPSSSAARLLSLALLCALAATLALAQTSPTPAAPLPASSRVVRDNSVGTTATGVPVYLSRNSSINFWGSEKQLNDYYVDEYIRSSGLFGSNFGNSGGSGPLTLEPSLRLVLAQNIKFNNTNITAGEAYRIEQLEMIGLAKHDLPVAFTVNRHSAMAIRGTSISRNGTLGPSPTPPPRGARSTLPPEVPVAITDLRQLTDFEKSALALLKTGQETVDEKESDGSRIAIGAIPAQTGCIQCHTGYKVGDPLGAFVYRLRPVKIFAPTLDEATATLPTAIAPVK